MCPYALDVPGGVQNHVQDLAAELAERGHDVAVLAPGDAPEGLPSYVTCVGRAVPVRFNGSVARIAFGPRVSARVNRWVAEGGFDVLHVHEPVTPSVSLLALRGSDQPVVATFHSAMMRSRTMAAASPLLRPSLEKINARIAVSEAARATLVQHLGGEPVIIPNGVSCGSFADAPPREEWAGPGPALVFLGRCDEPRKGLAVLLEAFPAICRSHSDARLLIAGRGEVAGLEGLDAGVRERVVVLGQISDADRARLLASATVYVAPHTGGESFGIVLVEAMAAGAAVVASDLPAFRAVLRADDFGVVFQAGAPDALVTAVRRLLDQPGQRTAMVARASREVLRYDWSAIVAEIEAVYDAVTHTRREMTDDGATGA